jgi:hypothetical protein
MVKLIRHKPAPIKDLLLILMLAFLGQCQSKRINIDGHYVSTNLPYDNSYYTLDIIDSIVLVNKNTVFLNQRDTIIIDPVKNSFVRSTRKMFPFFDFELVNDTVMLQFVHDGGEDIIKFIKATPSASEFFSQSLIEIEPMQYRNESQFKIDGLNIKNITVGPLKKGIGWPKPDSLYIEYENEIFIDLKDIPRIGASLESDSISNWAISLNLDKNIPQPIANQLRMELAKNYSRERITETRLSGNKLIYIEISSDGNKPD